MGIGPSLLAGDGPVPHSQHQGRAQGGEQASGPGGSEDASPSATTAGQQNDRCGGETRWPPCPHLPDAGATRIRVIPSVIARNPLMPIMPSTCRLMGLCSMASGRRSARKTQCARGAAMRRRKRSLRPRCRSSHRLGDDGSEALAQGCSEAKGYADHGRPRTCSHSFCWLSPRRPNRMARTPARTSKAPGRRQPSKAARQRARAQAGRRRGVAGEKRQTAAPGAESVHAGKGAVSPTKMPMRPEGQQGKGALGGLPASVTRLALASIRLTRNIRQRL